MINISIDIVSMMIGVVLGSLITSIAVFKMFFDERWHDGFSAGWDAREKFENEEQDT